MDKNEKSNPKLDMEQYDLLKNCARKKDMSDWNAWRHKHPGVPVNLEGIGLREGAHLENAELYRANLKEAIFFGTELKGIKFYGAHLEGAIFNGARLENAIFHGAHLSGAQFMSAYLKNVDFTGANMRGVNLICSYCEGATFDSTNLQDVLLDEADLQKAKLIGAEIQGASFKYVRLHDATVFGCNVDNDTDFTGVGLDSAAIEPSLKESFKNNIRRIQWRNWINAEGGYLIWKLIKKTLIRFFWFLTDYGSSTLRIVFFALGFALLFGLVYYTFETGLSINGTKYLPDLKSIVYNLSSTGQGDGFTLVRAIYFSIVTMTTLGFGEMHAATTPDLWGALGCFFISLQAIAGYVLLGALVTRLGILFTSEGPAQKPEKKEPGFNRHFSK